MSTLQVFTLILVFSTGVSACVNEVSRSGWGARSPRAVYSMGGNKPYVFIHHTVGGRCSTKSSCIVKTKSIQNYHMNTLGWSDIGYSFLVGEDGNVYVGRGWGRVGAHTSGYNTLGYGIALFGDFSNVSPSKKARNAVSDLIAEGVEMGYVSCNYQLKGHRDVKATLCPGTTLHNIIRGWPHY